MLPLLFLCLGFQGLVHGQEDGFGGGLGGGGFGEGGFGEGGEGGFGGGLGGGGFEGTGLGSGGDLGTFGGGYGGIGGYGGVGGVGIAKTPYVTGVKKVHPFRDESAWNKEIFAWFEQNIKPYMPKPGEFYNPLEGKIFKRKAPVLNIKRNPITQEVEQITMILTPYIQRIQPKIIDRVQKVVVKKQPIYTKIKEEPVKIIQTPYIPVVKSVKPVFKPIVTSYVKPVIKPSSKIGYGAVSGGKGIGGKGTRGGGFEGGEGEQGGGFEGGEGGQGGGFEGGQGGQGGFEGGQVDRGFGGGKKDEKMGGGREEKRGGYGEEGGSGDISGGGGDETQPQQQRRGRTPLPEQTQAARFARRG